MVLAYTTFPVAPVTAWVTGSPGRKVPVIPVPPEGVAAMSTTAKSMFVPNPATSLLGVPAVNVLPETTPVQASVFTKFVPDLRT